MLYQSEKYGFIGRQYTDIFKMASKVAEPQRSKKNTYRFSTGQLGHQIVISSNFDSGNIELVKQIT